MTIDNQAFADEAYRVATGGSQDEFRTMCAQRYRPGVPLPPEIKDHVMIRQAEFAKRNESSGNDDVIWEWPHDREHNGLTAEWLRADPRRWVKFYIGRVVVFDGEEEVAFQGKHPVVF